MGKISEKMKFIKGMDVSTLLELESLGVKFQDEDGDQRDVLSVLQEYGTNAIRIRLWNHPYSQQGEPYGGGTNDMESAIALAQRARDRGMYVMLDLHYSDFWADQAQGMGRFYWKKARVCSAGLYSCGIA